MTTLDLLTDDGWVSNIGNNEYGCPEDFSSDTEIEVKYRCGLTETGRANSWYKDWCETDGYECGIVAYRVIK